MSSIESKVARGTAGAISNGGSALEPSPGPAPHSPKQDLVFAVKLFGIAGLVVFVIWLMNRAVS